MRLTHTLYQDLDSLFDSFFTDDFDWTVNSPKTDIQDTDDAYLVDMELPGYGEDDIEIQVLNNRLTVQTKKKEKKDVKYLMEERSKKQFKRSFSLPKNTNHEEIDANMKNGMLTIKIPKNVKNKPTLIEVKKL